ncbi:DUF2780 domain-containing protein [Marinobacter fonticola]|uniref:DUF2780 domain-containing protein n=1 Tax=Marinobacter fonticola TaxID=2603215 RepID=UPI0011E89E78|nr:DUF2780 domain-containing protein [Marinobacter fonticola]
MNTIIKRFLIVSSLYLLAPSAGALDVGNKLGSGALLLPEKEVSVDGEAQALVNELQDQLGITRTQAVGGAGAMFQLAKNELEPSQFGSISDQLSGVGSLLGGGSGAQSKGLMASALSGISSMDSVEKAFSALGLQGSAVEQFAPIILDFLKKQGLSAGVLGNLTSLWTPNA